MLTHWLVMAGLALTAITVLWICRPCSLCRRNRGGDRPMKTLSYDPFDSCLTCRSCGALYVGRVKWDE